MLLFLTGPAGADKTTALKAAEQFCFKFFPCATYCGWTYYSSILLTRVWLYQHLENEMS